MRRSFGLDFGLGFVLVAALSIASPLRAVAQPFVGQVIAVGFDFCPVGWVRADGSLLAIIQYETLFNLIGTTYGGDGETTFAMPDLRGRGPIGTGTGPGLSTRTQAEQGGVESVTLGTSQLPIHTHALRATTLEANTRNPAAALPARKTRTSIYRGGSPPDTLADGAAITTAGGNQPHENMAPFTAIHWCIAYEGVFPSHP